MSELNDSGHAGTIWMGEDGEQTEVVLTLIEPDGIMMGMDHYRSPNVLHRRTNEGPASPVLRRAS